jgi:uncharacterized alpha-E superfamily protein
MLSRVANSIYWMSRYLERADNVARFIDVNTHLMLDLSLDQAHAQWYPLVATSGDDEDFNKRYVTADEKSVVRFLTFDAKNPNSIMSCIYTARENARTLREVIPVEMWELINELYHITKAHSKKRKLADLAPYYRHIRLFSHIYTGLKNNAMSRAQAWQFAHVGQMLERADKTARLIDVKYFLLLPQSNALDDKHESAYEAVQWGAVLKSAHALEMYRQRYHTINYKDVTQFLLFSPEFPRSVRFCLDEASDALISITKSMRGEVQAVVEMEILNETIRESKSEAIIAQGLHEFIDIFQFNLNLVDKAVYHSFFSRET